MALAHGAHLFAATGYLPRLSYWLPDGLAVVSVAVFIEQASTGFGLTAYMMFLIYYNRGEFRTSHYAIASALMTLSLMLPGLMAGGLEEMLGYRRFFFLTLVLIAVTWGVAAIVKIKEQEEI